MTSETHSHDLTMDTFDDAVLKSDIPVLVDFWAEWCGPCRMIAPTIDQLAEEYAGRAKVLRVNVDEEPELASRYGVQSIPTLLFFRDGEPVDGLLGAAPHAALASKLDDLI